MDNAKQIGNTPLSVSIYSVKQTATKLLDSGTLEIIFCLKGSVKFSYGYEEFTLHEGEFISVDRDAYYLYEGKDNLCVSFYLDLRRYQHKHKGACKRMFVCEGIEGNKVPELIAEYDKLKGLMLTILKHLSNGADAEVYFGYIDEIVEVFFGTFDIFLYHGGSDIKDSEILNRLFSACQFIYDHQKEKITIKDVAEELNLTENYVSKYFSKYALGFRRILSYLRASESESYLLNTDKTIIEISEECGFSDAKYYYAAFKEWYKCTPKQFRERYRNENEENIKMLDIDSIRDILDTILIEHYMQLFTPRNKS
ncbi:MAG: AraC family transcriptional regulator [Lachnospiraceae bacterium]